MRKTLCWLSLSLPLLFAGCDDADSLYSSLPAKFSYSPVVSMSQLYTSLNSQGEWCTIILNNNYFEFTNLTGTGKALRTAVSGYTGFYMGLCGFIVGLPNMPELGSSSPVVTCYDLACATCYHNRYVTKKLTLQSGGYAHCSSCDLTYNLNNSGVVSDLGNNTFDYTETRSLYRYHVYYGNDVLSISN